MTYIKDKKEREIAIACGKKIKYLREKENISQEKLAEILECSSATIGKIERGVTKIKSWRLIRFCEVFHVSMDYIMRDYDPSSLTPVPSYVIKLFEDADMIELEILSDHMKMASREIERKHILENKENK